MYNLEVSLLIIELVSSALLPIFSREFIKRCCKEMIHPDVDCVSVHSFN